MLAALLGSEYGTEAWIFDLTLDVIIFDDLSKLSPGHVPRRHLIVVVE